MRNRVASVIGLLPVRGLECVYFLEDYLSVRVVVLHLILECEEVDCVQYSTDGLDGVQKMSWSDLSEQGFLVLQL